MEKHISCYSNENQKIFIGYMKSKLDSEILFKFESGDFNCDDSGASVLDEAGKALGILHAKWITPYQIYGIASPYFAILKALDVSIYITSNP
ncbi:hypothetical protein RhiirB3_418447, partial [Rhizophagus irregularis]